MEKNATAYVGWLLLLSVLAFYGYGIGAAVELSWGRGPITESYNNVIYTTVGSIQALLLTNLGVLLGISFVKPESAIARQVLLSTSKLAQIKGPVPPLELREKIQLFAVVLYVVSLIVCSITWIVDDFSTDTKDVVPIIPDSGKMFLGVALAYLTAVLSNPQTKRDE
jgi:hypothetical protein